MRETRRLDLRGGAGGLRVRAFLLAVAWQAAAAVAGVEYRLRIDGVTDGWVPATGMEHAVTGSPAGLPAQHADLRIHRQVDRASPSLMSRLCSGQAVPLVRMEVRETTSERVRYFAVRLRDAIVTSYRVAGASPTNDLVETVALNYAGIEWTHIETDPEGRAAGALSTFWDAVAGTGGGLDADSDGDGIPDGYEVAQGLKPLVDDAGDDADTDGSGNLEEYRAGTAAADPGSVFRVTGIARPGADGVAVRVTFNAVPGRVYDLYAGPSLTDAGMPAGTVTATGTAVSADLTLPGPLVFVRAKVRAN